MLLNTLSQCPQLRQYIIYLLTLQTNSTWKYLKIPCYSHQFPENSIFYLFPTCCSYYTSRFKQFHRIRVIFIHLLSFLSELAHLVHLSSLHFEQSALFPRDTHSSLNSLKFQCSLSLNFLAAATLSWQRARRIKRPRDALNPMLRPRPTGSLGRKLSTLGLT